MRSRRIRRPFRRRQRTCIGRAAIISGAILAAAHPSTALDPSQAVTQYVHQEWRAEQGLPQSSVQAIIQDKDGYLWLGTQEGLARFDGVRFVPYRAGQTPGMTENFVSALLEDRRGNLWVGTSGGGVFCRRCRGVTSVTTSNGLTSDQVQCLYEDVAGDIWIGTDAGLNRWRGGTLKSYRTADGLSDGDVRSIHGDRFGNLWIATTTGLNRMKNETFTSFGLREGLTSPRVSAIVEDKQGVIWVGCDGGGVCRMTGSHFSPVTEAGHPWRGSVTCMAEDRDGNLWIGTIDGGLRRLRGGTLSPARNGEVFIRSPIMSLCEDREGNLWVGTNEAGLHQLRNARFVAFGIEEGLSNDSVASIYEDRQGTMWMGTWYAGLNRMRGGRFDNFRTKDGLSDNTVWSIREDRNQNVWIGTNRGLNRLSNGRFTTFTTAEGLANDRVWSILERRDGGLWIGTSSGLCRGDEGGFVCYGPEHGIPRVTVNCLHEEPDRTLWVGTEKGLITLKDGSVTTYDRKSGLPHPAVNCLYEDGNGVLWIGTNGGLARLQGGKLTSFTTSDGLFDNLILAILEDDEGNLWMSCNNGIFRVRKLDLDTQAHERIRSITCVSYGTADGMRSAECNGGFQPAACKAGDGRLWFPTIKGAVVIDPRNLFRNPVRPDVGIEGIAVDGRSLDPSDRVSLPAGSANIEFHYTALSFVAPERIRFKYQLLGFDDKWVEAGARRTAYYTRIPPGQYTLRVIACNSDGVWNATGASLRLLQRPLFHQTFSFYLLCAVSVLIVGFAAHGRRVRHLRLRERTLTARVEQTIADLKILRGLLPICASCKKIRGDNGYWSQLETYIRDHSQAEFTHSICPDCMKQLYPESRAGRVPGIPHD